MTRFPQIPLPILPRLPRLAWPEDRLLGIGPPTEEAPAAQTPAEPEMTPEEEWALLRKLAGGASYVAESLDKPAAAIRGLLAGDGPEQLLHLLPFSETLGIAPKKKVSGRKLLQKAGLLRANRPGLDLGDVAGLAAEIALDPLFYVTGPLGTISKGAAAASKGTKTLQAAQKALKATRASVEAGKLTGLGRLLKTPVGVAEQLRTGERHFLGLKLPFAKEPFATFSGADKVGAWAIEKAFYGGGHLNPLIWMRGIFSHSAAAKNLGEFFQWRPGALQRGKDLAFAERQLLTDALTDVGTAMIREEPRLMARFAEVARHHGANGDQDGFDAFTRAMLEAKQGLPRGDELLGKLREALKLAPDAALDDVVGDSGRLAEDFYRYAETIQEMQDATYARLQALGMPITWLDDLYGAHAARRPSDIVRGYLTAGKPQRFDPWYKWWMHRRWRDVPGMTRTINAIARDPMVTGTRDFAALGRRLFTEQEIGRLGTVNSSMARERLTQWFRTRLRDLGDVPGDIPQKLPELQARYVWKQYVEKPFNEFWDAAGVDEAGNLIDEAGELILRRGQPVGRQSELTRWLGGKLQSETPYRAGPADQPLVTGPPVIRRLRPYIEQFTGRFRRLPEKVRERGIFDRRPLEDALDYMHSVLEWESNLRSMHRFLGQEGVARLAADRPDWLPLRDVWAGIRTRGRRRGLTPEGFETFAGSLRQRFPQVADLKAELRVSPGTARILQNYIDIMKPQYRAGWQSFMDAVNRPFRSLYFLVWPASHVRNLGGGYFNAWSAGYVDLPELVRGGWAARNYLRGKGELQVEALLPELLKGSGRDMQIAGGQVFGAVPELEGRTILGHIFQPATRAGFRRRGVGLPTTARETAGTAWEIAKTPSQVGKQAYDVVEFFNRVGYAEALAKKGFADADIIRLVKEAQFDYSKASTFEREYVQRGVLFWSWPRHNVPFTLANIAARPGGRTAQTLRAMQAARGEEQQEYIPEMLRETLAVRTGGTQRAAHFLRQSGLPPEDLNRIVLEAGLPTGRTLERATSTLHPLLLAPLEVASGRQFYTGRRISDLYSTTEELLGKRVPILDRFLPYSPFARVAKEVAGAVDTRKTILQRAANALTGFKTTTLDLERLRASDLRRAVERELRRMPEVREITEPYIPRAQRETASQQAQRTLRQLQAVKRRLRQLAEQRAAEETP